MHTEMAGQGCSVQPILRANYSSQSNSAPVLAEALMPNALHCAAAAESYLGADTRKCKISTYQSDCN